MEPFFKKILEEGRVFGGSGGTLWMLTGFWQPQLNWGPLGAGNLGDQHGYREPEIRTPILHLVKTPAKYIYIYKEVVEPSTPHIRKRDRRPPEE